MEVTLYKDVNKLLDVLLTRIQLIFHNKLLGLYLYGSLASGDFDHDISDIDLLAVLDQDLNEQELSALKKMHNKFASQYPTWEHRIEVAYFSAAGLREFKNKRSKIAVISPGELLHIKDAGNDWLINWYSVQENGIALFGSDKTIFVPHISKDEYRNSTKEQAYLWLQGIKDYDNTSAPGSLAYVVFTLCRLLYGYEQGEQTSKKKAALWVTKKFPIWTSLIERATSWRNAQWSNSQSKDKSAVRDVKEFVNFVIGQILGASNNSFNGSM